RSSAGSNGASPSRCAPTTPISTFTAASARCCDTDGVTRSIGIDIGGTKMLCVAIDPQQPGTIVATARVATPRGTTALLTAVEDMVAQLDGGGDGPVGIGIPGLVNAADRFLSGPNLPG